MIVVLVVVAAKRKKHDRDDATGFRVGPQRPSHAA
jgi:hypothetical protein